LSEKPNPVREGSSSLMKSIPFIGSISNKQDRITHAIKLFYRPPGLRVKMGYCPVDTEYSKVCKAVFEMYFTDTVTELHIFNLKALNDLDRCGLLGEKEHNVSPVPVSNWSEDGCSLFMHLMSMPVNRRSKRKDNKVWSRVQTEKSGSLNESKQ